MKSKLKKIFENHTNLRRNSINLLPSENRLSRFSQSLLSSDMGQRYYFKSPFKINNNISYSYSGTQYIQEIVDIGEQIAKEIFNAKYASLYPISGHQSNLAILLAHTSPNDNIIVFDPSYGGYPGLDKNKLPKYLNLNVYYFPMIKGTDDIDYEKLYYIAQHILFSRLMYRKFPCIQKKLNLFLFMMRHIL